MQREARERPDRRAIAFALGTIVVLLALYVLSIGPANYYCTGRRDRCEPIAPITRAFYAPLNLFAGTRIYEWWAWEVWGH